MRVFSSSVRIDPGLPSGWLICSPKIAGMNKSILKDTFDKLLNGTELMKAVAGDKDVRRALSQLDRKSVV